MTKVKTNRLKHEMGWNVAIPSSFGVLLEGKAPVGLFNADYPPVDILSLLKRGVTLNEALIDAGKSECEFCGRKQVEYQEGRLKACSLCWLFVHTLGRGASSNPACAGWCGMCCCCGSAVAAIALLDMRAVSGLVQPADAELGWRNSNGRSVSRTGTP
jgi:hypothetical protein